MDVDVQVDFVMDGQRFTLDPTGFVPDVGPDMSVPVRDAWKEQVTVVRKPYTQPSWDNYGSPRGYSATSGVWDSKYNTGSTYNDSYGDAGDGRSS